MYPALQSKRSLGRSLVLSTLHSRRGFVLTPSKVVLPPSGQSAQSGPAMGEHSGPWAELPYDFLAGTELNFDPQASFNDYIFTGETAPNLLSGYSKADFGVELAYEDHYELSTNGYGSAF